MIAMLNGGKEGRRLIVGLLTLILFFGGLVLVQKMDKRVEKASGPDVFLNGINLGMTMKSWEENCQKSSLKICQNLLPNRRLKLAEVGLYQNLLANYPMEEMAESLGDQDRQVAAFLIAIAKKESAWGKYSPQKAGRSCYNYWGYKGGYNQTLSGYSCFDSPEQAVGVVGERIAELLKKGINTPEKMLVWKCGSSCQGHDPVGVAKWVSDVKSVLISLNS